MRVVIAPDSFKGSLTALEAAQAIAAGWKRALPDSRCQLVPLADGGEGTVTALIDATAGSFISAEVEGPYGTEVNATYGMLGPAGSGRAVIEMAAASGLHLRTSEKTMSPRDASSVGTGLLIADALERGATHILLGLGGSATNDGGTGMMRALGVQFLDADGAELSPGGVALSQLASIDTSRINPLLRGCTVEIASDVDNPLCGPTGASVIFGAQKGASPEDIVALDSGLQQLADVADASGLGSLASVPGAGAAGGMGYGALTFLGAAIRPGIDLVIEAVSLREALTGADLLITGEGRIDRQTLAGKTPFGAMQAGVDAGVPTIALVGSVGSGADEVIAAGMTAIFSIVSGPVELHEAIKQTRRDLERTAQNLASVWSLQT